MLIAASAILLALGVLAYRKPLLGHGQGRSGRAEAADVGLFVLRLVVLLLFAAVFIGAVLSRVWTERPRRVAVMLDVSESMTAVRAESVAVAAAEGFPLPDGAARQEWVFGDTAKTIADFRLPIADSANTKRTRIGAALKTAGKTRPGAVVLLSDGQDNGEVDAVAAARELRVPVHTVGFGGRATRNLAIRRVVLPAVIHAGETVDVQVRVGAAGFAEEKTKVRLRGDARDILVGQAMAEQDVPFRVVFDRPGRQTIQARADTLAGESNYADNVRSVVTDVRPGRVRVAYVTNRPGPGTRAILRALKADERVEVEPVVAVTGGLENGGQSLGAPASNAARYSPRFPDVFIIDNVVETGRPEVWQSIADQVGAGAGALVLAGTDFQPGPSVGKLLDGTAGRAQTGSYTPELTAEGAVLPWWGKSRTEEGDNRDAIGLGAVPPFAGLRPLTVAARPSPSADRGAVWLVAQENKLPIVTAQKSGRGRVVYVAGYPLWRWGFGPDEAPGQGTPLSNFLAGVVRYLAERDTSPFHLQVEEQELYQGQPVHLVMRAVAPDGTPWSGLGVLLDVYWDTGESAGARQVSVPMTETAGGVYQSTLEALRPGRYRAVAKVSLSDTVIGNATAGFAVAEQSLELARTGMNDGLLRAIAQASGGRFYPEDSLPRDGAEVTLGSYERRLVFDPRRAVWAYVLIALLAGTEWLLRRRRGLL